LLIVFLLLKWEKTEMAKNEKFGGRVEGRVETRETGEVVIRVRNASARIVDDQDVELVLRDVFVDREVIHLVGELLRTHHWSNRDIEHITAEVYETSIATLLRERTR
jgi:hypothetical protein